MTYLRTYKKRLQNEKKSSVKSSEDRLYILKQDENYKSQQIHDRC